MIENEREWWAFVKPLRDIYEDEKQELAEWFYVEMNRKFKEFWGDDEEAI